MRLRPMDLPSLHKTGKVEKQRNSSLAERLESNRKNEEKVWKQTSKSTLMTQQVRQERGKHG